VGSSETMGKEEEKVKKNGSTKMERIEHPKKSREKKKKKERPKKKTEGGVGEDVRGGICFR